MKSKKRVLSHLNGRNARVLIKALLLGLFALNRQVKAQEVLAPPPQAPDQTPSAIATGQSKWTFLPPPKPSRESQPFKWEDADLAAASFLPVSLRRRASDRSPTNWLTPSFRKSPPGALLEIGSHWTLDYSPLWTVYSNNKFQNTFGQAVRLAGGTAYNDWVLGISQGYTDSSSPSVETATQTRQEDLQHRCQRLLHHEQQNVAGPGG